MGSSFTNQQGRLWTFQSSFENTSTALARVELEAEEEM